MNGRKNPKKSEKSVSRGRLLEKREGGTENAKGGCKPKMDPQVRRVRSRETGTGISVRRWHLEWPIEEQQVERSCTTNGASTKSKGMESGYAADDSYNVYDKGLFTSQNAVGGLYRSRKDADSEVYAGEQLDKALKADRFRADKGFVGAAERESRDSRPVNFEEAEEADPFGLDHFLTEVKKGKKALDRVGGVATMRASGGSGTRESYEGGCSRSHVDFERGGR